MHSCVIALQQRVQLMQMSTWPCNARTGAVSEANVAPLDKEVEQEAKLCLVRDAVLSSAVVSLNMWNARLLYNKDGTPKRVVAIDHADLRQYALYRKHVEEAMASPSIIGQQGQGTSIDAVAYPIMMAAVEKVWAGFWQLLKERLWRVQGHGYSAVLANILSCAPGKHEDVG